MAITPQTDLYLLKCPIEQDNRNQINFASATAQYNYFSSLPKITYDNFSYQRKDNVIRIPEHIDNIIKYNYVMYRNDNYSSKWFYAFITDMEYASDHMTFVTIKTDVYQTWQFDLTFKRSFVEREHVNDDTFGLHTIPESFELGEYVNNGTYNFQYADPSDTDSTMVMVQVTKSSGTNENGDAWSLPSSTYAVYNGIPQGCSVFGIPLNTTSIGTLHSITGFYDGLGLGNAIISMSLVPKNVTTWTSRTGTGLASGYTVYVPDDSWTAHQDILPGIARNTTIDGYTPKNNKCFTGQFNYLYLTNNLGGDIVYHYEDFTTDEADFAVVSSLEQGGSIKIYPQNSKKTRTSQASPAGNGWVEGLSGGKLPAISWSSDYYLNWQAVNGSNMEIQTGLATVGLFAKGSNILDFASQVGETVQQIKEAKMTPPQAKGNVNAGDIAYSDRQYKFTFRKMSIKAEYAKIIDDYFSAFGYKVNRFKVPNVTGRSNWNYVKTIGANIEGNIPQADMDEIKTMFDSGITIWHNTSTYLDYSQSNNIV